MYISKNYKYRFKTKQEFLDEFGDRWRNDPLNTGSDFIQPMDCLLGKDIDNGYYWCCEKKYRFTMRIDFGHCSIQPYMYKKVWDIPSYKPRTLIKN